MATAPVSDLVAWAELIKAIATLLWPISMFVAMWLIYRLRRDFLSIAHRVRKLKLFGQEVELDELRHNLDKLTIDTQAISKEQAAKAIETPSAQKVVSQSDPDQSIFVEAGRSPKAALLHLSAQLEAGTRILLESTGWHGGDRPLSLGQSLSKLKGLLPDQFPGTFKLFMDTRNRIAHGYDVPNDDVLRAIDIGLELRRIVNAVPREVNEVYAIDIPIYSDAECAILVENAKGIMLKTRSPDGATNTLRIFPTTRSHFLKGKRVAWEWNGGIWGPCWYRHPDTGAIHSAWESSAEFIGQHLDE